MSFTINQTGIERDATQLLFPDPPILLERHEEDAADAVYEVSLPGNPIVVQYVRDQPKSFLKIRLRLLDAAEVATLVTLMEGSGPVTVKLTPGDAAEFLAMFGPRDDQDLMPYNDDFATGKPDGSAVDTVFTQYRADLFLLRLE